MKNTWVAAGLIALGAFSFSSCSLEPYVITAEEQYMRDFIKKFGLVDAEQDWNMAKSEDIKVNVGAGVKHLKLYAKVGQKYYLIADYYDVEGTFLIPVDVPEDTKDILAIADGRRYYGTIGTTIDCTGAGSRADGSADNFPDKSEITTLDYDYQVKSAKWSSPLDKKINTSTTYTIGGKDYQVVAGYLTDESNADGYEIFNAQQISPITSDRVWRDYYSLNGTTIRKNDLTLNEGFGLIPEGGLQSDGNKSNPGIIEDFTITDEDGKFVIYPMYWNTSQIHELGIYLYDEYGKVLRTQDNEIALFPVFLDKRGTKIKSDNNGNTTSDLYCYDTAMTSPEGMVSVVYRGGKSAIDAIPKGLPGLGENVVSKCIKNEDGVYKIFNDQEFKSLALAYVKAFNNPSTRPYFKEIFPALSDSHILVKLSGGNWSDGAVTFRFDFEDKSKYPTQSGVKEFFDNNNDPAKYQVAKINNNDISGDDNCAAFSTDSPLRVKNRAYFVYLPDGYTQKFGMYIKFNDVMYGSAPEKILYSESEYNDDSGIFACSFRHPQSGRTFFSFEDWWEKGDQDLNDLVFRIDKISEITGKENEAIPEISEDPISWIWAVEDLGSTDDFDFNDIVIKIQSVSTNVAEKDSEGDSSSQPVNAYKKVTFTPLAAGGTLPTYIHWKKAEGKDYVLAPGVYKESEGTTVNSDYTHAIQSLESLNVTTKGGAGAVEYHQWFGNYPHTQMINTGQTSVDQSSIKTCVIYLDSDFKLDCFGRPVDGMGKGLYVSINGPTEGENTTEVDKEKADKANYNVSSPDTGAPAQMFIIFDNHWAWPVERTHITDAYPLFKDWAGDKKTDWTMQRGTGPVVNR